MMLRWLHDEDRQDFRDQYARAREDQADTYADQMVEIADTEDDPQRARVRIDARKWVSSKLRPKRYGDRLDLNHGGNVTVNISSDDADL